MPISQERIARLIPAWAGKTPCLILRGLARSAHPRVGGENQVAGPLASGRGGSSPRGRGKRASMRMDVSSERLIPRGRGKP